MKVCEERHNRENLGVCEIIDGMVVACTQLQKSDEVEKGKKRVCLLTETPCIYPIGENPVALEFRRKPRRSR